LRIKLSANRGAAEAAEHIIVDVLRAAKSEKKLGAGLVLRRRANETQQLGAIDHEPSSSREAPVGRIGGAMRGFDGSFICRAAGAAGPTPSLENVI
jgi:hypothetical protein